jgi:tetratricopeptide (TPR) repeat protein
VGCRLENKELTMQLKTLMSVMLFAMAGTTVAQTGPSACQTLLDSARALQTETVGTPRIEEALTSYERAFQVCETSQISPELAARVAVDRAKVLRYRGDDRKALQVLQEGLATTTAALGENSPTRVELLENLAQILGSSAGSETPGADEVRALEYAREALRVRRAAYGERSLETAAGLSYLAAGEVASEPEVAEKHAREALGIAREHDDGINEEAFDALLLLEEALRAQGENLEADAVREESSQVSALLEKGQKPQGG